MRQYCFAVFAPQVYCKSFCYNLGPWWCEGILWTFNASCLAKSYVAHRRVDVPTWKPDVLPADRQVDLSRGIIIAPDTILCVAPQ